MSLLIRERITFCLLLYKTLISKTDKLLTYNSKGFVSTSIGFLPTTHLFMQSPKDHTKHFNPGICERTYLIAACYWYLKYYQLPDRKLSASMQSL
jgi:hypothetical protein